MGMPWLRLYAEFATDSKVQTLSEEDQRRYIMLLCMRCANGNETFHVTDVIFYLRISLEEWAQTLSNLRAKKLVTEDGRPITWDKRQFASDSSTDRVRRFRKKQQNGVKQLCNVPVTPPDTDTDTEEKKKEIIKKIISKNEKSKILQNAQIVFEHWKKTLDHPRAIFDERRKRLIHARLKTHAVEDLLLAIDGCKASEFHMGQNEQGKIFDSIDLIFRNTDKLEYFINLNKQPQRKSKADVLREKNFKNLFGVKNEND